MEDGDRPYHNMAEQKAFLVPVVVDGTRDQEAFVPDAFRAVQWTRLPGGDTSPAFVERIRRLLSPELPPLSAVSGATAAIREPVRASWRSKAALLVTIAVVVAALGYLAANQLLLSKRVAEVGAGSGPAAQSAPATATAFNPPPYSIAVLPFVNMSGDASQEYFSDGLTEELLNSLARINQLQVAARTSAFSFKGKDADINTIAHKLNVAAVLEGSVRRAGNTVRITAQLINAASGFHLWSQTYDRDLGDILKLQTEIADAVASALKVTLVGDVAAKIEAGGTRNPAALDAYLRAWKAHTSFHGADDLQTAIAGYSDAIRLDPSYALAFAGRSIAIGTYGVQFGKGGPTTRGYDKAETDARTAIALAPDLAEAHFALALHFIRNFDFIPALHEYERAFSLAPGSARLSRNYSGFAVAMRRTEAGIAAARRAVALDPLNRNSVSQLGQALFDARRYDEAIAAFRETVTLDPEYPVAYALRAMPIICLVIFRADVHRAKPSRTTGQVRCAWP
jgi:TolB-like protein